MKLLQISITTNEETGANFSINEMEMKESNSNYNGEGRRIAKDKLLKADSYHFNNGASLHFFTYCLPEDKEASIKLLIDAVNERFAVRKNEFLRLATSVQKLNESNLNKHFVNATLHNAKSNYLHTQVT